MLGIEIAVNFVVETNVLVSFVSYSIGSTVESMS